VLTGGGCGGGEVSVVLVYWPYNPTSEQHSAGRQQHYGCCVKSSSKLISCGLGRYLAYRCFPVGLHKLLLLVTCTRRKRISHWEPVLERTVHGHFDLTPAHIRSLGPGILDPEHSQSRHLCASETLALHWDLDAYTRNQSRYSTSVITMGTSHPTSALSLAMSTPRSL